MDADKDKISEMNLFFNRRISENIFHKIKDSQKWIVVKML